jgi:hypothetical protein
MTEEINVHEDSIQFYGAFSFSPPIQIDDLATQYKGVLPKEELDSIEVELYILMIPHMKKHLLTMGISHSDLDEALSISYDVFKYLLDKWEIKYYGNRNLIKNNLKGAKKNSFYGYFFTYYKSIFYQKWNYSKDFNGNLIKASKTYDLKAKDECNSIDRKVNVSRKNKEIIKGNIIEKYKIKVETTHLETGEMEFEDDKNIESKMILMEHLRANYTSSEMDCLLYKANVGCNSLTELRKKLGVSKEKCNEMIESTMYKAERDKVLFSLWEEGMN